MGKRLDKTTLRAEIARERAALDALLAPLTPREMTEPGVTQAGWSVKDLLGHLVGWQAMNLAWYEAGQRGEVPEVPAPGLTWRDVRELNARIFQEHHRRPLDDVVADYRAFHQRMLDLIAEVPDDDFVAVGRYAWAGPTWSLSDYVRANTASHYRWAIKHLRNRLRARATKEPTPKAAKVEVQNINTPGRSTRVDAQKHEAMRAVLLKVLPEGPPGLTQAEMAEAARPLLPQDLWPDGSKSLWWVKTVQLDLEAKGTVKRDRTARPLRWFRVPDH